MKNAETYRIDWDGAKRQIAIPRDNLSAEIEMTDLAPEEDPWQLIRDRLENPIGCAPFSDMLRGRKKLVLTTGDRLTDRILGVDGGLGIRLIDYLNSRGVGDGDITLLYAPGSHPSPTWRDRLGPELLRRVAAVRHDCFDENNLRYLGVTSYCTPVWVNRLILEADLHLAVGEISPTLHGGWCGGGKIVVPGLAGWDTIQQNHYGVIKNVNTLGLADGNHMRRDMEEGARLARLDMKLDVLVNSAGQIVDAYAGDFIAEHRAALNKAREIWMTGLKPADIYVVYPGSQSERYLLSSFFVRIEGADLGTAPNGIIIMVMSAAGGWAPDNRDNRVGAVRDTKQLFKAGTEAIARQMVRRDVNVRSLSMLYSARRVLENRRVFLVCDGLDPLEAGQLGFEYCTSSFEDALQTALEDRGGDARIAVNNVKFPVAWRAMPWREG